MRAANRLVAALLALLIAGAGLLGAAEVVVARTGWAPAPWIVPYDAWLDYLRPHRWNETYVRLISVGVILLGLILIALSAFAGQRRVTLASDDRHVDVSTSRRSMARALQRLAQDVDGVRSARVVVRPGAVTVRAEVGPSETAGDPAAIDAELDRRLSERLAQALPVDPPRVLVRSRPAKGPL